MKTTGLYRARNLKYHFQQNPIFRINKIFVLVVFVVFATTLNSLTRGHWLVKTKIQKERSSKNLSSSSVKNGNQKTILDEQHEQQQHRHKLLQRYCLRQSSVVMKDDGETINGAIQSNGKISEKRYYSRLDKPFIKIEKTNRKLNLKGIIRDVSNDLMQLDEMNLFYNDYSKLIFCSVPKVASTNWKRIIHTLQGRLQHPKDDLDGGALVHDGIPRLKKLSKYENISRKKKYFSFLFTRHPFERVFSAYRDKIQSGKDIFLYKKYNRIIFRLFRNEEFNQNSSHPATLTEFIRYIIRKYESGFAFKMNRHWRPVTFLCSVCKMNYTVIGKMETIASDSRLVTDYIFTQTGLNLTLPERRRHKNKSSTLLMKALKNVPRTLIKKLYSVYESDFDAFGYTIDKFI